MTLRKCLAVLVGALVVSAAFFVGIVDLSETPTWWPESWAGFVPWVKANQYWLLPGPPVLAVALQWIGRWIERWQARGKERQRRALSEERLQRLLGALLRRMRAQFVPQRLRDDPDVHHRLTIFRANSEQTYLEIVARSCEATSGSATRWAIHPDIEDKCEGVAGVAWFLNAKAFAPNPDEAELPDVSGVCDEDEIERYATRTFVSPEQVREFRWQARSFAALALRVGGKRWGVLVLDSVDPGGANSRVIRRMEFTVDMLGDIIREWSDQ